MTLLQIALLANKTFICGLSGNYFCLILNSNGLYVISTARLELNDFPCEFMVAANIIIAAANPAALIFGVFNFLTQTSTECT